MIYLSKQSKTKKPAVVLITGASRGIGNAIARKLAQYPESFQVNGTSRQPQSDLITENGGVIKFLQLDLTKSDSIADLVDQLPQVDILINNAGCSHNGPAEEIPISRVREYFELNFFGMTLLIQAYLPYMRKQRFGYIINISSMASESPVPFSSFYAASKAAVNALTYGLANEIAPFNVKALVIAPFEVNTALPQDFLTIPSSPYYNNSLKVKEARDQGLAGAPSPEIVAEKVFHILSSKSPKNFYPTGKNARFKYFLIKHLPRSFIQKQTRKIFNLS
ncbi:MAG: short-chain dehydrogenase/reductase [Promethearchaeia archaeon]|nr:MAG: short-chain dehydrogenase/reductase [Candidatus Lokiarchaeia archaeon]